MIKERKLTIINHSSVIFQWKCSTNIREGSTPYNGLYGEVPPERGTFSHASGRNYTTESIGIEKVL